MTRSSREGMIVEGGSPRYHVRPKSRYAGGWNDNDPGPIDGRVTQLPAPKASAEMTNASDNTGNAKSAKRLLRMLGPGLVPGAADDDPSGIATYSQGGAQFGYALGWTMFLTTPFMIAIQMVGARVGAVTGQGLAANLGKALPRPVLYAIVGLLLIANTLNIAADIAAMGDALRLVVGGPMLIYIALFGIGCLAAEILIPYHIYSGYLKVLTLALFAYVATAFTV